MSDKLDKALRALNKAAYDAVQAGKDTTLYPMLDRQQLRELCTITDNLVDKHAATGSR